MEAKQELEQVELWARQVAQALGIGAELVKELLTQQRYREESQTSPLTALARWKRQGHELGTFSVEESLGESFGRCLKQVHVVYYSVKAEGKEAFIFRDKDSATVQQVGREFQHELAGKFQASPAREFQHAMAKNFQERSDRESQHKLACRDGQRGSFSIRWRRSFRPRRRGRDWRDEGGVDLGCVITCGSGNMGQCPSRRGSGHRG